MATRTIGNGKAVRRGSKATPVRQTPPPTHEEIAHLAEKYWAERGRPDGSPEQDWLRAERELLAKAS